MRLTPEQIELGRKVVDASWWEWPTGVLALWGQLPYGRPPVRWVSIRTTRMNLYSAWVRNEKKAIDLTDAGTGGILLEMIRALGWQPDLDGRASVCRLRVHAPELWEFEAPHLAEVCAMALLQIRGE